MVDLHAHIINEIDDGSRSFEESVSIIKKMANIGYTSIVATPHYITGSKYLFNNVQKNDALDKIRKALEKEDISVELYLGNEVFIDPKIVQLIKSKKVATINNSKYVLIEFPVARAMNDLLEILFQIRSKGYVPIIAHPERYQFLQEDPSMVFRFIDMGCLFQGNIENMAEKYGIHAKKLFIHMLKHNQLQFLATDVHHEDDILFQNFEKVKKDIIKLTSKEKFEELTNINPLKVLNNENVEYEPVQKQKKFLFFKK